MNSKAPNAARRRLAARLSAEMVVVLGLVAWWLTSVKFPPTVFPSPGNVLTMLGSLALEADFWLAAATTGGRILTAVLIATFFGSAIGMLPRYVPWTRGIVDDVIIPFFTSFPAVAWAILGSVWFGVGATAITIVQIMIIFPFCLVNVSEGAKELGTEEVEMGLSFGRSKLAVFWRIELPLLSPFIVAGARIAYGVCWKVSLIAELFGANSGLGHKMQLAQDFGQVDTIIAICLAIVIFVVLGDSFVLRPLSRMFDVAANPPADDDPPREPVAPAMQPQA
jgi:NitT/TauT family transport system permease protein